MVLPDGRIMCDLDGCSSSSPKQRMFYDTRGSCYCEYHKYLVERTEALLEYFPDEE